MLIALSADARGEVDEIVRNAVAAGASTPMESKDYRFMYQRGFQDLDGHLWEIFYMDLEVAAAAGEVTGSPPP